jgi:hypothetical protein
MPTLCGVLKSCEIERLERGESESEIYQGDSTRGRTTSPGSVRFSNFSEIRRTEVPRRIIVGEVPGAEAPVRLRVALL